MLRFTSFAFLLPVWVARGSSGAACAALLVLTSLLNHGWVGQHECGRGGGCAGPLRCCKAWARRVDTLYAHALTVCLTVASLASALDQDAPALARVLGAAGAAGGSGAAALYVANKLAWGGRVGVHAAVHVVGALGWAAHLLALRVDPIWASAW
jgi:hypothetical protein